MVYEAADIDAEKELLLFGFFKRNRIGHKDVDRALCCIQNMAYKTFISQLRFNHDMLVFTNPTVSFSVCQFTNTLHKGLG